MGNWLRKLVGAKLPPHGQVLTASDGSVYWLLPLPSGLDGFPFALIYPEGTREFKLTNSIGNTKVIECTDDVWFVDELHIKEPHRRKGLATLLLKHIITSAREANVRWLIGMAIPYGDPDPTFNLFDWYKSLGFGHGQLRSQCLMPHNIVYHVYNKSPVHAQVSDA